MNMAGQTINDRLLAARHSLAGQGLAKSVCKATTEEMIGPKKKHLDYLVHCTNEPNVSIPHLANLLVERSQNANWVVVYKALITVHHLLAYGNERFIQYLASSNSTFNLSNFLDKGGVQGAVGARIGYDMSPFIRRYAKYLNEKAISYRTVAFDFCKVKRGKEEGSLRTMNADKLLKTLPVLQAQLDALLEFDCTSNDLSNGVINMCFMLLFRDLIRLFACYNDGIINLLEKYFDMNKKQCRDALDLYKRFLVRMDRVGEFLKVAENVGIDKGDIPDLTKAPSSLLDALEQHLASVEGKKGSAANTPTQTASQQKNVKSAVSALSSTSSAFGTAAASTRFDTHTNGIDDEIKAQALAEEEAAMNKYKTKVSSPTNGALTNPFLSSPPASQGGASIVDLFGSPSESTSDYQQQSNTKASDDLLQLGNPFGDMFGGPPSGAVPQQQTLINNSWNHATDDTLPNPFMLGDTSNQAAGGDIFGQPGDGNTIKNEPPRRPPPPHSAAHTGGQKSAFDDLNDSIGMAFTGSPSKSGIAPQQPVIGSMQQQQMNSSPYKQLNIGGPGAPQSQPTSQPGKVLTGDLDSSLASLAENLTINKSASAQVKGVQWNSPKNAAKPSSTGWTPQPMAATTGAGYRPMAQGMTVAPAPSTIHSPLVHAPYPVISPFFQQGMPVRPAMVPGMPIGSVQQPNLTGIMGQQSGVTTTQQTSQSANNVQLDPFGAF